MTLAYIGPKAHKPRYHSDSDPVQDLADAAKGLDRFGMSAKVKIDSISYLHFFSVNVTRSGNISSLEKFVFDDIL